jgi:hypothetical protein
MVASVEKVMMEEGTKSPARVEHARYDGGERDGEGSLIDWFSALRCLYAAKEL